MSVQWTKLFNLIPLIGNHLFGAYCVPAFPLGGWASSLSGSPPSRTAPCPGWGLRLLGCQWVNTPPQPPQSPAPSTPGLNKGLLLMNPGWGWRGAGGGG